MKIFKQDLSLCTILFCSKLAKGFPVQWERTFFLMHLKISVRAYNFITNKSVYDSSDLICNRVYLQFLTKIADLNCTVLMFNSNSKIN